MRRLIALSSSFGVMSVALHGVTSDAADAAPTQKLRRLFPAMVRPPSTFAALARFQKAADYVNARPDLTARVNG